MVPSPVMSIFVQSRVEPGDWDWTAISANATMAAALITAITVVFILFQTRATRKAAEQAERSADAAFKALDYSQRQLDYARRQHRQSMHMAAEAVKARIDAELPRLVVQQVELLRNPKLEGAEMMPDALFEPRDNYRTISHTIRFQVKNDGPRTANLQYSEPIIYETYDASGTSIRTRGAAEARIPLSPGQTLAGEYTVSKSVGFWIEDQATRSPMAHEFSIRSLTDADTGANEIHRIGLSGSALVRDVDQLGRWVHIAPEEMQTQMKAHVLPIERMYFLSRRRNERLPEIPWTSFEDEPVDNLTAASESER